MKGQNFASQVLSRHTFRISRKTGSDFFDHRGTLSLEVFAFGGQSMKFTMNMLLTCILYRDTGGGCE